MPTAPLDIRDERVTVNRVTLAWAGGKLRFDGVRLDTGSGVPVLVPRGRLEMDLGLAWEDKLEGLGGEISCQIFDATVVVHREEWRVRTQVWVSDAPSLDHVYLGLPILRHFELLLRGPSVDDPDRPVLFAP